MVATSFSALMPRVLRLIHPDAGQGVHLTASVATPLADWGRAIRTENDAECALEALEPLMLLLSVAGYGVPEIVFAGAGVTQADVVSIRQPALEIRRGTQQSWTPAPTALAGLRVCPTTSTALDLATELSAYKPTFSATTCGWLLLPVSEADLVTSIDDLVTTRLWPPLAKRVAAGSASTGVGALIDVARNYSPVNPLATWAALPDLAANALLALQSLHAAGVLEAEYLADRAGRKLSQQIEELQQQFNGAASWLAQVDCRGRLAAMAESLSGWWPGQAPVDEAPEPPSLGAVEALGLIRALLVATGTTSVVDAPPEHIEPVPAIRSPLNRLPAVRAGKPEDMDAQAWEEFVSADELVGLFIKLEQEEGKTNFRPAILCTLAKYSFTRSTQWDDASGSYPALPEPLTDRALVRPIDFARTRFEMEAASPNATVYLEPYAPGASAIKRSSSDGSADQTNFWCSALTIWTLAASGYDMNLDLLGLPDESGKREPHGYVDKGDWKAITPAMLVDGQAEACLALGVIMRHAREQDPRLIPGRTVVFDYDEGPELNADGSLKIKFRTKASIRNLQAISKPINTRPPQAQRPKPPKRELIVQQPLVAEDVSVGVTADGVLNPYVFAEFYESGTYQGNTEAGRDYDDSLAVRLGPGAVKLLDWGETVPSAQIRPGDIGQYVVRRKDQSQYDGKGHAFQIWSVKVKVDGKDVIVDPSTDARSIPVDAEATEYCCIDANINGASAHPYLTNNSGVSISTWIPVRNTEELNRGRRYYFARLHESPWCEGNLAAQVESEGGA